MNLKKALLFSFIITFFAPVFAIPKGPHVFSGYVFINGVPAPDGTLIEVKVSGLVVARTFTQDGAYNYSENGTTVFYVPDNDGTMPGKVLKFYVRGIYSEQYVFESFAVTKLNLNVETVCGNAVCEPGESSSNCCTDCGCSAGYSCISNACTENAPYCGDGACNGAEDCSTCASDCGTCPPSGGGNTYVPPAEEEEEETEPYCGDGTCDNNETCATCTQDCGKCPPECLEDTDCDDGDECTRDTCNESCSYEIICEEPSCEDECSNGQVKCDNNAVYACASDEECLKWTKNNDCANGCCGNECCAEVDFNEEESGSNGLGLGSGGNPGILNTITGFASNLVKKPFIPVIIIGGIGVVFLFLVLKKPSKKYY